MSKKKESCERFECVCFVQSVDRAKQLFNELIFDGIRVDVIHSQRSQKQREAVVQAFRTGRVWMLIATDLMARGVDFKGVNCVINYDVPQKTTTYIHRIGRTGRAGRSGEAITLFTEKDAKYITGIAQVVQKSGGEVPEWMLKIKKANRPEMQQFAQKAPNRKRISDTKTRDPVAAKKFRKAQRRKERRAAGHAGGGNGNKKNAGGKKKRSSTNTTNDDEFAAFTSPSKPAGGKKKRKKT